MHAPRRRCGPARSHAGGDGPAQRHGRLGQLSLLGLPERGDPLGVPPELPSVPDLAGCRAGGHREGVTATVTDSDRLRPVHGSPGPALAAAERRVLSSTSTGALEWIAARRVPGRPGAVRTEAFAGASGTHRGAGRRAAAQPADRGMRSTKRASRSAAGRGPSRTTPMSLLGRPSTIRGAAHPPAGAAGGTFVTRGDLPTRPRRDPARSAGDG